INGTLDALCLWEITRSITTLSGHGRKTVRAASSTIAAAAPSNGQRYGRSSRANICQRPRWEDVLGARRSEFMRSVPLPLAPAVAAATSLAAIPARIGNRFLRTFRPEPPGFCDKHGP